MRGSRSTSLSLPSLPRMGPSEKKSPGRPFSPLGPLGPCSSEEAGSPFWPLEGPPSVRWALLEEARMRQEANTSKRELIFWDDIEEETVPYIGGLIRICHYFYALA